MSRSPTLWFAPLVGVVLVVASISSVQLGAAIGKSIFDQISPAGLTFVRLLLAAVIMVAIARPRPASWSRSTLLNVLAFGAVLGAMNLLYYASLERIPLSVAVTLELVGPLTVALVHSRRASDVAWVLCAAAGVGIIAVQGFEGSIDLLGCVLALAAGACWGGYILLSQRVGAAVPGLSGLSAAMVVGALVALPFGAVPAVSAVIDAPAVLGPAALVALLSSVLAYGLELLALRRITAHSFGVFMALEPAAAALFGFLLLAELVDGLDAVAIALVIVASAGVAITAARAAPRAAPPDLPPLP
ncbi:EamA family transporter [Agrococcus sp. DT81.2]|uniref:EamA family transporter n=1 Tax=Agrococcus sp. DT81.2 TaxID=3393414 RepID=UPI003CE50E4A